MKPPALSVAHAFVEAINPHSVEQIASLMTGDHVFIDSLEPGSPAAGR